MLIVSDDVAQRKLRDDQFTTIPTTNSPAATMPVPIVWTQPVPGEEFTTIDHVYQASRQLVAAGLSVIPIDAIESSKSPDFSRLPRSFQQGQLTQGKAWAGYTIRRPSEDTLRRWYDRGTPYGLAVVAGTISGGGNGQGLEIIDFDAAELAIPWMDSVEQKAPGLIQRLVRVQSPRPGLHCYYRCSHYGGSQKLAMGFERDADGQIMRDGQGNEIRKTMIELKGEGGYCLIPPSPPRCHPSMRLYRYVEGSPDLTCIPTITPQERAILLQAARILGEVPETPTCSSSPKEQVKRAVNPDLPGDDFNDRANWSDILTPHGWTHVGTNGEVETWCRPGKTGGVSATVNYQGNGLLHVFSSNASPLELDRSYSKFAVYAHLNHQGDFKEAAQALIDQGYGKRGRKLSNR